jgi:polyribonucleotide nucleotidyltransferase
MTTHVETQFLNRALSLETGKVARQAHGAVWLRHGSLVVLATAVSPETIRDGIDFFPLSVEYRERFTAVGKFPGGYIKRENRPTEKEILTARCIDRPLRPLFPQGYFSEVQLMVNVLSTDPADDPDTMAVVAASAAVAISDIPFAGPIAAVRVSSIDGELRVNASYEARAKATLDFVIAGTRDKIVMIEGQARQAPEAAVQEAIAFGHQQLQPLITLQEELIAKVGKAKRAYTPMLPSAAMRELVERAAPRVAAALHITGKTERNRTLKALQEELAAGVAADEQLAAENPLVLSLAFDDLVGRCMQQMILKERVRVDGRGLEDIRPIACDVGILPRTHGSALFVRGETQSLAVTTLGTSDDEQSIELLSGETSKKFMLHYSFPPFATGEVKPIRGPGRREIGHGDLAERSLRPVIPGDFMYTIRVTSDITESNGSSSMASVCGGCLALMDAGVPISAPVAGISIGLVQEGETRLLLTDIVGDEDHYCHMDFKVAGTAAGVTGVQVDLKIDGLPVGIIGDILARARTARLSILETMQATLAAPKEISPYAPKILTIRIPVDKIGAVIGPGGKMVRKIQEETKTSIAIEDDGTVQIAGDSLEIAEAGRRMIEEIVAEAKIGEIYEGPVTRILPFGAFVKILPETEGMVHISEISNERINAIEDALQIGDIVKVRVIEVDEKGRVNLTMRALDAPFDPSQHISRSGGGGRGERSGHDGRGRGERSGGRGERNESGNRGDRGRRPRR